MRYRCWAEVDLDALRQNLAWLRHHVGNHTRIMTVVKADAYGHGLKQTAAVLMQSGTDVFGIANLEEARAIRSVGQGWPILMLGACLPEEIPVAVRDGVMATVSSLEEARAFSRAGRSQDRVASIHIKVDTGMGRLGVPAPGAPALFQAAAKLPHLRIAGVYTHYASAEDDPAFTCLQRQRFRTLLDWLNAAQFRPEYVHASNSGGVLREPEHGCNTVRPGLLVYGLLPSGRRRIANALARHLQPALSWRARVSFVKPVTRATPLGYGGAFVAPKAMRVATVTAGYGDGYLRSGSGRSWVLVRGHRCRVIGRISMDQMLVDVTAAPRVRPGDTVVLIGQQGRHRIDAHAVSAACGTIPWEVLTNITYRVPRVYRGSVAA
jgi:alanine racemase